MPRSKLASMERTVGMATKFLDEMRADVERIVPAGGGIPPRVRCVHERPGHATPEYRTVAIPVPEGMDGVSPEVLSGTIARYAEQKKPDRLFLALDLACQREDGSTGPVLIAEARDRGGTRLFWMQPYDVEGGEVRWGTPADGGWRDPGAEEMILDGAFAMEPAALTA